MPMICQRPPGLAESTAIGKDRNGIEPTGTREIARWVDERRLPGNAHNLI